MVSFHVADDTNEGWLLIGFVALQKCPKIHQKSVKLNQKLAKDDQHEGLGAACQQHGDELHRGFAKAIQRHIWAPQLGPNGTMSTFHIICG